jgi:hypothetical protein
LRVSSFLNMADDRFTTSERETLALLHQVLVELRLGASARTLAAELGLSRKEIEIARKGDPKRKVAQSLLGEIALDSYSKLVQKLQQSLEEYLRLASGRSARLEKLEKGAEDGEVWTEITRLTVVE